jgi:HK97 family phage major capsid protein
MSTATDPDLRGKLTEVNEQIATASAETQKRWKDFDEARAQFAQAGNDANRTDSDEFKKAEDIHKQYAESAEQLQELEAVRNGIFQMLGENAPQKPNAAQPERQPSRGGRASLADRAVQSDEYKALLESGALESNSRGFNATLATMSVDEQYGLLRPEAALLTGTSDTSGGAFVTNQQVGFVPQPRRMTRILDLVTQGQTTSDTVEYVRQSAFTNVAAETAESTTTDTGTKPEATIAFAKITESVRTIAHWVPATRRALADVGQLRTLIDSQLRYGLEYRLESQIVAGNGSGENLTGILNTGSILSQPKGSDSVSDAVHKAITQLRLGFIEPNGIALHPNDWEVVRLSRDDSGASAGTGSYLYGPPSIGDGQQMWGLPVAVSAAVTDDTGIVADFRYATLWLREGAQVLASDSHSDFFVKNLVAVLAEMRAAFGVQLPAAFCKVTSID